MKFTCLTWNTAKRLRYVDEQVELIRNVNADIVALQEVIESTNKLYLQKLINDYPYISSSFDLVKDKSILKNKRMFGQIIASKFPLEPEDPMKIEVPWNERVLSVTIQINDKYILFHTTHIPPGSQNGWIKIQTLNGIYNYLKDTQNKLHILCGDFNTPKEEFADRGLMTFAQRINAKGELKVKSNFRGGKGEDWDRGERDLMNLKEIGYPDSYRLLNSYTTSNYSWSFKRKEKIIKRRFDHFFASEEIQVISIEYLHNQKHMSDHSPLLVKYAI